MKHLHCLAGPEFLPALKTEHALRSSDLGLGLVAMPPRILLLYGLLGQWSCSRFVVEESARLLQYFGCETRIFDPSELPMLGQAKGMFTIPDQAAVSKVNEQFNEAGRMRASRQYDRLVDVNEALVRFTILLRSRVDSHIDRYSDRVAKAFGSSL